MRYFVIVSDHVSFRDAIPVTVFLDYHLDELDAETIDEFEMDYQFIAGPLEADGTGFIAGFVSDCQILKVM